MNVSDFDYDLPPHFIAQTPAEPRDSARLLTLDRATGAVGHHIFRDIVDMLEPGDVLVINNTRVIPARIPAVKAETGGNVELLLLRQLDETRWRALVGGRRLVTGTRLSFPGHDLTAEIVEELEESERIVAFSQPVNALLSEIGQTPLPPYIHETPADFERYQTVYSRAEGSAAAPTAGLHFTGETLLNLRAKGVHLATCTLHIGLDTFKPVSVEKVEEHHIHSEWAQLSATDARLINEAKLAGGRIIAVGTTTARTIETAGILSAGGDPACPEESANICPWRPVIAFESNTQLFIYPGYHWRVLDGLITNFHLPRSSLLMMISAFAGRDQVFNAYEIAKAEGYRFYSFGDAMFIR